jgi:hypothetical protein
MHQREARGTTPGTSSRYQHEALQKGDEGTKTTSQVGHATHLRIRAHARATSMLRCQPHTIGGEANLTKSPLLPTLAADTCCRHLLPTLAADTCSTYRWV